MRRLLFLFLLVVFVSFCDAQYLLHETLPQSWDQAMHLTNAMSVFHSLTIDHDASSLIRLYYMYPAFYYVTTVPFLWFNAFPPAPLFVNILYGAVLCVSVYYLSLRLFKSDTAGAVSAMAIASFPFVISLRRTYLLDFPVLTMSALAMAVFIRGDGLPSMMSALTTTALTTLAFFTKQFALLYLFPFYFYVSLFLKKISFRNTLILLTLFASLVLVWAIPNYQRAVSIGVENRAYGLNEGDPQAFSAASLLYYFGNLQNEYGALFLVALAISFALLVCSRNKRILFVFLLSASATLLLLAMNPNKDPRYGIIFPLYAALVLGGGVSSVKKRSLRILVLACLLGFGISGTVLSTLGVPQTDGVFQPYLEIYEDHTTDWKVAGLMTDLKKRIKKSAPILLIGDYPYININTYNYYAALYKSDFVFASYEAGWGAYVPEYVLTVNDVGPMGNTTPAYLLSKQKKAFADFQKHVSEYEALRTYPLADGYSLILYKRKQ